MKGSTSLAVIPARGGSKGIPRKNLSCVNERPLLAWTLLAAKNANLVDVVIVSTDDADIAELARTEGAEVVWRPAELATDEASSESALLHALEQSESRGHKIDTLVFLQCTSPLTTADDIDGAITLYRSTQADCVFSGTEFHHFLWRSSPTGMVPVNHDAGIRHRRQDTSPQLRENGAIYVMNAVGFQEHRHRFFGKIGCFEMPASRSWEIDSMDDLLVVQTLANGNVAPTRRSVLSRSWCRAIVFDFDGVLTENGVWIDEHGTESVRCDRRDGYGFELAQKQGLRTLILSKEQNAVVRQRALKLNCEVIHGVDEKEQTLSIWLANNGLCWGEVAYLGNDLNDLGCIHRAHCGMAVADADATVRLAADYVTTRRGGYGAAREVLDLWMASG